MLQVDIEKIVPVTEARDMFNKIVDEVEGSDEMYVMTKNGKPSAVIVGVNHLEKLTGEQSAEVMAKIADLNQPMAENPATDAFAHPAADANQMSPAAEQMAAPTPAEPMPAETALQTPEAPASQPDMPNLPPAEAPAAPATDPFAAPPAQTADQPVLPANEIPAQNGQPPQQPGQM